MKISFPYTDRINIQQYCLPASFNIITSICEIVNEVRLEYNVPHCNIASNHKIKQGLVSSVVVAPLVEQSLQIPEVRGSNPAIANIYNEHLFTVNCIEKRKRGQNVQLKKIRLSQVKLQQHFILNLQKKGELVWEMSFACAMGKLPARKLIQNHD